MVRWERGRGGGSGGSLKRCRSSAGVAVLVQTGSGGTAAFRPATFRPGHDFL